MRGNVPYHLQRRRAQAYNQLASTVSEPPQSSAKTHPSSCAIRYHAAQMLKGLLLAALLTSTTLAANAQSAHLGSGCNLTAPGGAKPTQDFPTFDKELRQALKHKDVAALALLIKFPLRVNVDHDRYYIDNAAALQSQFSILFPPSIRNAVINQKPSNLLCTFDGIGYGNGDIWVNLEKFGYAVEVVNLPSNPKSRAIDRIGLVCRTKRFRILVDSPENGNWRYRSWNAGRSVLDQPSLTLDQGKHSIEGTDGCTHDLWIFKNGSTTYWVSNLGCTENAPPHGARGQLEVHSHGKTLLTEWCY